MRFWIKLGIVILLLGAAGALGLPRVRAYWKERNRPRFRQAKVEEGEIIAVVNSTGTIQPVLRVQIGSFVSGPIDELLVDFNAKVRKDDLLARIDPRIYKAAVARDEATLATANAEVTRVTALYQQATNDEKRSQELRDINEDYIADTVMDQYKFNRQSHAAQLEVALASVEQAKATLQNSRANLGYTEIRSPVDGIVINRTIDEGQTLAAQFTTPELFVVAPDMEKQMYVYASVDEADIGLIRQAQKGKEPVKFTVDAYPEDLFEGTVHQIRMNPTTEQNVVTYPVVITAPNPDLKLLPGMTASISFQVSKRENIVKIPNAALRFYPKSEHVRKEDRDLLEGKGLSDAEKEEEEDGAEDRLRSAAEKAAAGRKRNRRHVWILEGDLLKAVEVTTGVSDHKHTELVAGELKKGQELVTGLKTK